MKFHFMTLLLLWWTKTTLQRSSPDSPTYTAAIVEYSPITQSANRESVGLLNARNYLKIIDKAAGYGIDIIVFPESSLAVPTSTNIMSTRSLLATYIPDPEDNIIPCIDNSTRYKYTLRSMSCAARHYKIYVLINHREKVDCEQDCGPEGLLVYNSNVAFDREGRVISRYRKYHLYEEGHLNRTVPIPTSFTTDFGVTFGTFICFDLVFALPALNLTRLHGITDILYPVHWFDVSPFLFATEMQAAFAYSTDVNLLASGYSFPDTLSGGSGIYLGKRGYAGVVSENKRTNVLMVAEVPKVINGKRTQNFDRSSMIYYEFKKEEIATSSVYALEDKYKKIPLITLVPIQKVDVKDKNHNTTVCNRGFCCNMQATIDFNPSIITKSSNYYRYRFGGLHNSIDVYSWSGFKMCAIIACTTDKKSSCGQTFHDSNSIVTPITFRSLTITTSEINNEDIFVYPLAYTQKFYPLNATDFKFTPFHSGNISTFQMELTNPVNDLLGFAILVRESAEDRIINSKSAM